MSRQHLVLGLALMTAVSACANSERSRIAQLVSQHTPTHEVASTPLAVTISLQKSQMQVGESFDVLLRVINTSDSIQQFRSMICSWPLEWRSSNNLICPDAWGCLSNVPQTIILKPGQSYQWTLPMRCIGPIVSNTALKQVSFRMGFTPIGSKRIYWSDTATLRIMRHAQPLRKR